jgi:hypothetical protein
MSQLVRGNIAVHISSAVADMPIPSLPLLIQEQAEKEDKNGFEMYKQGEVEAAVRYGPIAFIKCLSVAASLTGAYCARDEMCFGHS